MPGELVSECGDVDRRDRLEDEVLDLTVEALRFHELLLVMFVFVLRFSAFVTVHPHVVGDGWVVKEYIFRCAIKFDVVVNVHEHAKMAKSSSSESGGDGLCVVVEFELEFCKWGSSASQAARALPSSCFIGNKRTAK